MRRVQLFFVHCKLPKGEFIYLFICSLVCFFKIHLKLNEIKLINKLKC